MEGQESSSPYLYPGSPEETNAPHPGSLNANWAGLVGHMQVRIEKERGAEEKGKNEEYAR